MNLDVCLQSTVLWSIDINPFVCEFTSVDVRYRMEGTPHCLIHTLQF
jgi:hypothetical protein